MVDSPAQHWVSRLRCLQMPWGKIGQKQKSMDARAQNNNNGTSCGFAEIAMSQLVYQSIPAKIQFNYSLPNQHWSRHISGKSKICIARNLSLSISYFGRKGWEFYFLKPHCGPERSNSLLIARAKMNINSTSDNLICQLVLGLLATNNVMKTYSHGP